MHANPRKWYALLLVGLLSSLTSTGCSSAPKAERDPLPFTVALIPVTTRVSSAPEDEESRAKRTELQLQLDGEQVSDLLVNELDQRCFTHSMVLGLPTSMERSVFLSQPLVDQEQHWLESAAEQGADLVVLASLRYDPTVYTSTNDRFWLNLPLFLLGGPMTWFVDDRSYYVDAKLEMEIFDLNSFRANREASLSNKNYNVLREGRVLSEVSLDFIDRAGGNVGSYALSIFIPSGFLAKENEAVLAQLESDVVTRLSLQVVEAIREQAAELKDSPIVASFQVGELRVEDAEIVGRVRLTPSPSAESMRMVRVSSPGIETQEYDLLGGQLEANGQLVYDVRVPVPAGADLSRVKVEFFDASEVSRSYTLDARASPAVYRR